MGRQYAIIKLPLDAFAQLGLQPVTAQLNGAKDGTRSIDHFAVPLRWSDPGFAAQTPTSTLGQPLSDHPICWSDVDLGEDDGHTFTPVFGGEFNNDDLSYPVE